MLTVDWIVLGLFFLIMIIIGALSFRKVRSSKDFFVAGGKIPWWLSGISHHVSGYSGAVFVGYAALAYTDGFTIYVWWAFTIAISTWVGAKYFASRWSRLREELDIQSPLEYLSVRYNVFAQQLMAWSGVLLKLFDVGAKWAAIAVLLHAFTGTPIYMGVLLAGGIALIYITIGGLWADMWTDFAQFAVQITAGLLMFFIVMMQLGGVSSLVSLWDSLPESNATLFNENYTVGFALTFLLINFLSYNGGTWNLATRYISASSGSQAVKAARLSSILYLIWPLILFFPMWAAPVLMPDMEDPSQSYAILTQEYLPNGLIGLVLASLFANTMSMTSSDSNTVASVISRDILPRIFRKLKDQDQRQSLILARGATFIFTFLTLLVALQAESFGGVLGLIISWYGALLGPVAIPMLFGLLPLFSHYDHKAAVASVISGFSGFIVVKYVLETGQVTQIATPILVALVFYLLFGWLNRKTPVPDRVKNLLNSLEKET